MSGSHVRFFLAALIVTASALSAYAQPTGDSTPRAASFVAPDAAFQPQISNFSGLAAPPDLITPPVAAQPASAEAVQATTAKATDILTPPVATAVLPNVSPESIGVQNGDGLGADMWKNTPRPMADTLLADIAPTTQPTLNHLVRRLLTTAAIPPDGETTVPQSLTAQRAQKLANLGDVGDAWSLVNHVDAKLVDDVTFHTIAEAALASSIVDPCGAASSFIVSRPGVDWQKLQIVCELRAKDTKTAQTGIDVMRAQSGHDVLFLNIADKNIIGSDKRLPFGLTPLTATTLAMLRLAALPLPSELYTHADYAFASGLLHTQAQDDLALLSFAERSASRGLISATDLGTIYAGINFKPDQLAAPLTSTETGLRLHALLYRAAFAENDSNKKVTYAIRLAQSMTPALFSGAPEILIGMLGDTKPDPAFVDNAVALAQIYVAANQNARAMDWVRVAQGNSNNADALLAAWPSFALSGMESESAFAGDLGGWLDATLKSGDAAGHARDSRENTATILSLLDAAGLKIPNSAWSRVIEAPHSEKHYNLAPVLFDRLQAAGNAGRKAETILLAVAVAGENEISLPIAIAITRALRQAGFKSEAAIFARQMLAILVK